MSFAVLIIILVVLAPSASTSFKATAGLLKVYSNRSAIMNGALFVPMPSTLG